MVHVTGLSWTLERDWSSGKTRAVPCGLYVRTVHLDGGGLLLELVIDFLYHIFMRLMERGLPDIEILCSKCKRGPQRVTLMTLFLVMDRTFV